MVREVGKLRNRQARKAALQFGQHALDTTTNDGWANLPVCPNLTASQRSNAGGTMGMRAREHRFARSGGSLGGQRRPTLVVSGPKPGTPITFHCIAWTVVHNWKQPNLKHWQSNMKKKLRFFLQVCLILTGGFYFCGCASAKLEAHRGKPFQDSVYHGGPQKIPGLVQCACYDFGGEGVAYHNKDTKNHGSGELNPANGTYLNEFRMKEGISTSYTKFHDETDNSPYDLVQPPEGQLYVGWTSPGEWFNMTVAVDRPLQSETVLCVELPRRQGNAIRQRIGNPARCFTANSG
jgi:hypothetical protein